MTAPWSRSRRWTARGAPTPTPYCRPWWPPCRQRRRVTRRSHDRRRVGDAEQPGGRGCRSRLLPRPHRVRRGVVVIAPGRPVARPRRRRRSPALGGAAGPAPEAAPEAADVERASDRVAMFGRLGLLLMCIAVAVHFLALLGRGMSADPNRVPWGNMYEFTLTGTFVVAFFYLVLSRRWPLDWLAPLVVAFVLTLLMVAVLWLYDATGPLPEALNSYWLVIHAGSAIRSSG